MRRILSLIMVPAAFSTLCAQDFVVPQQKRQEITPQRVIVEPKPTIDGIVKDIFVTRKPWQMVNPVAPAEYGTGERLVSRDSGPGTPYHSTGLVVLGVEW